MTEAPGGTPMGWYPDPGNAGLQRYWDGRAWTAHTAPAVAPRYAAPPRPPRPPASAASLVALVVAFSVPAASEVLRLILSGTVDRNLILTRGSLPYYLPSLATIVVPTVALAVSLVAWRMAGRHDEARWPSWVALVVSVVWMAEAMLGLYAQWGGYDNAVYPVVTGILSVSSIAWSSPGCWVLLVVGLVLSGIGLSGRKSIPGREDTIPALVMVGSMLLAIVLVLVVQFMAYRMLGHQRGRFVATEESMRAAAADIGLTCYRSADGTRLMCADASERLEFVLVGPDAGTFSGCVYSWRDDDLGVPIQDSGRDGCDVVTGRYPN